ARGAARRAERRSGARDRGPRLCHGAWSDCLRRTRPGSNGACGRASVLPGAGQSHASQALHGGEAVPEPPAMALNANGESPGLVVREGSREVEGLSGLDRVKLVVEGRTLAALVGPNGAGKTSLLNCVGGFYTPSRGTITFGGVSLAGLRPDRIAAHGIARSFQFVELFRHMSV